MSDDVYPDVPVDSDQFDRVVLVLSQMDLTHYEKAVGMAAIAVTEFRHAKAEGTIPADEEFGEFAERVIGGFEHVLERMEDNGSP